MPKVSVRDPNVPGPGQYELSKELGSDAPKYIFYRRDKHIVSNEKFPSLGPGQYKQLTINQEGRYILSHIKNVNSLSFGNKDDNRFCIKKKVERPNLGPGQYETYNTFNKTGFSFLSNIKSSPGRTFGRKLASSQLKTTDLGPGQYKVFSEFGYSKQDYDFSPPVVKPVSRNEGRGLKRSHTAGKI